jgi:hypothetical protein
MASYVTRSREIVDGLDAEMIGGLSLGDEIYRNNFFVQYALGGVEVAGEQRRLAAGVPAGRWNSQTMFTSSLAQAIGMTERDPELYGYMPGFIAAMAVGEEKAYWAAALLTEDVIRAGDGKKGELRPPIGELAEKSVQLGIPVSGEYSLPVAHSAAGQKIAAFYPPRLHPAAEERCNLEAWARDAQRTLTVVIEPDSELAISLAEHGQRPV